MSRARLARAAQPSKAAGRLPPSLRGIGTSGQMAGLILVPCAWLAISFLGPQRLTCSRPPRASYGLCRKMARCTVCRNQIARHHGKRGLAGPRFFSLQHACLALLSLSLEKSIWGKCRSSLFWRCEIRVSLTPWRVGSQGQRAHLPCPGPARRWWPQLDLPATAVRAAADLLAALRLQRGARVDRTTIHRQIRRFKLTAPNKLD